MRKIVLKIICLMGVLALALGLGDYTGVGNSFKAISIHAKTKVKKTKYKNGKIKTKTVTKYFSKKTVKKYKQPSRLKSKVYTKYNKKGQIIYKRVIKASIFTGIRFDEVTGGKNDTRYYKYTWIKGKRKALKTVNQTYVKLASKKNYRKHGIFVKYYHKKTGKIAKEEYINQDFNTNKITDKWVFIYDKNGKYLRLDTYEYKNGKYI